MGYRGCSEIRFRMGDEVLVKHEGERKAGWGGI
jgi:hypothetical protein